MMKLWSSVNLQTQEILMHWCQLNWITGQKSDLPLTTYSLTYPSLASKSNLCYRRYMEQIFVKCNLVFQRISKVSLLANIRFQFSMESSNKDKTMYIKCWDWKCYILNLLLAWLICALCPFTIMIITTCTNAKSNDYPPLLSFCTTSI